MVTSGSPRLVGLSRPPAPAAAPAAGKLGREAARPAEA
jgi:hypothetical protein